MLRCGQMLLAETFSRIYLTRDFKWERAGNTGTPFYWKILSYFKDEKLAPYSVQQIAMMGVSEGIQIGKWFGPNTIAQVLKYVFPLYLRKQNNLSTQKIIIVN
jgi:cysteine protease ATG4